ncbi:universal stress protein [Bifidobacterium gallicum]|uniref:Universal stress family protein n=1 Tax=Bifidobacterium gallicum DSM 20093 = LMG 11596 TaxID=561180 RepID=D1NU63_9BIFI|nr:universal stress protein [Bifidobacterium gallicum]EFA23267.1 universal stress family protein [Bifidobacterium gallicum DSM 20093 = LMG 11596]KFI58915.1 universal stress protein [Bifidobacterium gallicum DSM 20093 = LMG 11596]
MADSTPIASSVTVPSLDADIVVGVDGSDESFAALRWALRQAEITGQCVNAVYGWSYSWDMGPEPESEEDLRRIRLQIAEKLHDWVAQASEDMDVSDEQIKLTSFRSSGSAALLEIGHNAQQIVVGRRTMGRLARWFAGSLSASLIEEAQVPVTVIRTHEDEDFTVQDQIANSLTPGEQTVHYETPTSNVPRTSRPIVAGVDGSEVSRDALEFAAQLAAIHHAPLHVMFCWQLKDLGAVKGYETTVPPMDVAQQAAQQRVQEFTDSVELPVGVQVTTNAFHILPGKGLVSASRYARHLVVGSRGLNRIDAHFLGSVSRQVLNSAECNITIVH